MSACKNVYDTKTPSVVINPDGGYGVVIEYLSFLIIVIVLSSWSNQDRQYHDPESTVYFKEFTVTEFYIYL